jgi:glutamate-1-semialdehyde 2,1-aminomutase
VYEKLESLGAHLEAGWKRLAKGVSMARVGSLFWPYFDAKPVPTTAEGIDAEVVGRFHARYRTWLDKGVYLPPSGYEVGFLSTAHSTADVDRLLEVLFSEA